MSELKMPERQASDGACGVNRLPDDRISINVTTDGVEQSIAMSPYNAWRAFGMLSVMLEIPLPKSTGRAIKM